MNFSYLGAQITSNRNCMKTSQISYRFKDIVWDNNYLSTESIVRINQTFMRSILTYAAKTRAKTNSLLRVPEMNRVTLRDQIHNSTIREELHVEDTVRFSSSGSHQWRNHGDKMQEDLIAQQAKEDRPYARRPPGRPQKMDRDGYQNRRSCNELK